MCPAHMLVFNYSGGYFEVFFPQAAMHCSAPMGAKFGVDESTKGLVAKFRFNWCKGRGVGPLKMNFYRILEDKCISFVQF